MPNSDFFGGIVLAFAVASVVSLFVAKRQPVLLFGAAGVALILAPTLSVWFASPLVISNKELGNSFSLATTKAELIDSLHPFGRLRSEEQSRPAVAEARARQRNRNDTQLLQARAIALVDQNWSATV